MNKNHVQISQIKEYDEGKILNNLPSDLFGCIIPGDTVVLKPNWIRESHIERFIEWEQVITHPSILSAVINIVVQNLKGYGKIIITDGPDTSSDFEKILKHYPVETWINTCKNHNIILEIIDLRDDEWKLKKGIIVNRRKLKGDPKGKVVVNLIGSLSEFNGKSKSRRGFYGADYNRNETNEAHDGVKNLYSVSRTVVDCDVFVNLPKLKTHKKAGITCCLKNLVGINTYKNYLPHYNEGSPNENGDQFSGLNKNSRVEGPLIAFIKQHLLINTFLAKVLKPGVNIGIKIFGKTNKVIRSGNWYGNDVIWRTILDLNKVLFYSNGDGSLRPDNLIHAKKYIGIVDAIVGGEGNGPLAPDAVSSGYLICGTNPVAIDAVCAEIIGFDYSKIPSIYNAFRIKNYRLVDFSYNDIKVIIDGKIFNIENIPLSFRNYYKPHFGWKGHIEKDNG